MSPSIGVLLPSRELAMYPPRDGDPRRLVAMAMRVEESGFDSAWLGDSLLAKPRAEPLTVLAAAAVATRRIELGTAVLLAAMRRSEQLAQHVRHRRCSRRWTVRPRCGRRPVRAGR
jgi:alkanesulfonate monooxygenase SsuD/methylene tetrahydromethanopterin reductase-like flavin-dependent oxidoreductase (luciferase family)